MLHSVSDDGSMKGDSLLRRTVTVLGCDGEFESVAGMWHDVPWYGRASNGGWKGSSILMIWYTDREVGFSYEWRGDFAIQRIEGIVNASL